RAAPQDGPCQTFCQISLVEFVVDPQTYDIRCQLRRDGTIGSKIVTAGIGAIRVQDVRRRVLIHRVQKLASNCPVRTHRILDASANHRTPESVATVSSYARRSCTKRSTLAIGTKTRVADFSSRLLDIGPRSA